MMQIMKCSAWTPWALAGASLIATLCAFAPLPPAAQSSDCCWAYNAGLLAPAGKVAHAYSLVLSPAVADGKDGPPVRFLSVSMVSKVGEVMLQHRHEVKPVVPTSSAPVTLRIEDLNLSYANYFAGQVLGTDPRLAPAEYSDAHVITIQPAGDATWGGVAERGDFSVSILIEPPSH